MTPSQFRKGSFTKGLKGELAEVVQDDVFSDAEEVHQESGMFCSCSLTM